MKKLYILLSFILFTGLTHAQLGQGKKQQDIEALRVAFISKELELTPIEAQKFWPIYNQYSKEISEVFNENEDVIDRDEKVLNIRKRYKKQFSEILGQQRVNTLFSAEGRFRKLLIKSMRKQERFKQNKQKRQNNN